MAAGPGTFEEDLAETKAGLVGTLSRMSVVLIWLNLDVPNLNRYCRRHAR